jgi:hypothetical protein
MVEKNRGPLAIRKNILEDYKKNFGDKKLHEDTMSVTLPNEISFQLVLRTRECATEVIDLLRKNKIFSKISTHHFTNEEYVQDFDTNMEYPFLTLKTEVFNLGNLYKTVKICKNCFIVYSLTSKYFDNRLKGDLKNRQWKVNKTTSLIALPKPPPQSAPAVPQSPSNDVPESPVAVKSKPSMAEEKEKVKVEVEPLLKTGTSDLRRFRIMRRTDPKIYKLYMPQTATESRAVRKQAP